MLVHYALVIQKSTRRWMQRQRFLRLRAAVIVLQKNWRACAQKAKYRKVEFVGQAMGWKISWALQLILHKKFLKTNFSRKKSDLRGREIKQNKCQNFSKNKRKH